MQSVMLKQPRAGKDVTGGALCQCFRRKTRPHSIERLILQVAALDKGSAADDKAEDGPRLGWQAGWQGQQGFGMRCATSTNHCSTVLLEAESLQRIQ